MSDELYPAKPAPIPDDIVETFRALCAAARIDKGLAVLRVRTTEHTSIEHYVIAVVTDEHGMIPIALVPHGKSVIEYLRELDSLHLKGAADDPQFKGVLM